MRPFPIVLDAPRFDLVPRIVECKEDVFIQAFVAQPCLEALDVRVLNRLARFDELQPYPMLIGPLVERPAAQLGTVIRLNRQGQPARGVQSLQDPGNTLASKRQVDFDSETFAAPLIEPRERAEVASANQAVMNEVDRPGLIRRHRSLACHPQMAQPLAPALAAQ